MIPVDKIVADDLAALAADSRRQLRSADELLHAPRAVPGATSRRAATAVCAGGPAALQLASAHASRIARIASGATAVVCTLAVLVVLRDPRIDRAPGIELPWWAWSIDRNALSIGAMIAALAVAAHVVAGATARRWFESRARRASADGRDALAVLGLPRSCALDGWSVALAVAGPTCAAVLVAVLAWSVDHERCTLIWYDAPEIGALLTDRVRDLTIGLPAVLAAALALGHACARGARWPRVLEHRGARLLGWIALAIAVRVAFAHHLRPFSWNDRVMAADSPLRAAVTAIGGAGVLLLVANAVLRRRRGALAGTGRDAGASAGAGLGSDDLALLAFAGVFRSRVTRMIAGAVAGAWAVGLLIVLHNPHHAIRSHHQIWRAQARLQLWLFEDHVTIVAIAAAVVLGAGLVGGVLADRLFGHSMRRCPEGERQRDHQLDLARRIAQGVDGGALAIGIAGVSALVVLLGVLELTIGDDFWLFFEHHGARVDGLLRHTLREIVAAVALGGCAALALGQAVACTRRARCRARWIAVIAHPAVIAAGVALVVAACVVWLRLDFGVDDVSAVAADQPSPRLQSGLTAALTAGVLLITSGLALRRRRGEHERTGQASRSDACNGL